MARPLYGGIIVIVACVVLVTCERDQSQEAQVTKAGAEEGKRAAPEADAATDAATDAGEEPVYVPKDLEDALGRLDDRFSADEKEKIKKGEIKAGHMHFGLGMWMRNNWGLWKGSRLARYFNGLGIRHPDDMSGIILESYMRRLKGEPIELEKQVAHYQEYWAKMKAKAAKGQP
ncbi:DUF6794 domain-containing protein [Myxococcota bacterium]